MGWGQSGFGVSLTPSPQEQAGESTGGKGTGERLPLGFVCADLDHSQVTSQLSLYHSDFKSKGFPKKLKGNLVYFLL